MPKKWKAESIRLPQSFVPFILQHLDMFEAHIVGESIVISMTGDSAAISAAKPPALTIIPAPTPAPPPHPIFIYRIVDRKLTPEQAARYGFSEQRLKVYRSVYEAGASGVQSKELLTRTGLPHGTVQQILRWLRDRKMVSAESV